MDSHVRPAEGNQRRKLELNYLAVNHEISRLIGVRVRDRQVLQEISCLAEELSHARTGLPWNADPRVDELTMAVVEAVEASVRIGMGTAQFRNQFLSLQKQLAELGTELGYN